MCITNCAGTPDGDYQSCKSCDVYATCIGGTIFDSRPCPLGTVWDDNFKRCDFKSTTCFNPGTVEPITQQDDDCITSCLDKPDGDYQSCQGCSVYASCVGGYMYDNRPCPPGTSWDDNMKQCVFESSTCFEISKNNVNAVSSGCTASCADKEDGDYQSCEGCDIYISCVGGQVKDKRLCPPSQFWDDNDKACLSTSSTCQES